MGPVIAAVATPLVKMAVSKLWAWISHSADNAETEFGPKTGETKFELVSSIARTVADSLSRSGKLPGVLSEAELATVVETIVQAMKINGGLGGALAPATPTGNSNTSGTRVQIIGTMQMVS